MIAAQMVAMILKEHAHQPISGDVLLIGRQTVPLTTKEVLDLMIAEGIEPRPDLHREIDTTTIRAPGQEWITDRAFFSMFADAKVRALDVSNYEGAEIVHDLNAPLPGKHKRIADFIFNGSCLDNLFDPAMALKSMSAMLRPGGRIMHMEHGSPIQGALLCYSPEWFFDFYAVNGYADCQSFVATFPAGLMAQWDMQRWQAFVVPNQTPRDASLGLGDFVNVVIATKGKDSTDDKVPIQGQYRAMQNDAEGALYLRKFFEFEYNARSYARSYAAGPFTLPGAPC